MDPFTPTYGSLYMQVNMSSKSRCYPVVTAFYGTSRIRISEEDRRNQCDSGGEREAKNAGDNRGGKSDEKLDSRVLTLIIFICTTQEATSPNISLADEGKSTAGRLSSGEIPPLGQYK